MPSIANIVKKKNAKANIFFSYVIEFNNVEIRSFIECILDKLFNGRNNLKVLRKETFLKYGVIDNIDVITTMKSNQFY